MMKINKPSILIFTVFLLACNKNPYAPTTKKIDDEQALTRTKEILDHQNDTTFTWPSKCSISIKINGMEENIEKDKKERAEEKLSDRRSIDLDNLIYAFDTTATTNGETYKEESYKFWKDNIYYYLINKNGQKSRTEKTMERSDVEQIMKEIYDDEFKYLITGESELVEFPNIEKYDKENKKLAEESSYYTYDYQYGSNNDKSFERTENSKFNRKNFDTYKSRQYTNKERILWTDDLQKTEVSYYYYKEELDGDDYFAQTEEKEERADYSYNSEVKINLPNIDDYPLQEK